MELPVEQAEENRQAHWADTARIIISVFGLQPLLVGISILIMAARKAAIFDLWGCVQSPRPLHVFRKYEEFLGLSRDFLHNTIVDKGPDSALHRAELGRITQTQMLSELQEECQKEASSQGHLLPPQFSVQKLFQDVREALRFNIPILQASATLRHHGVATCVLANSWVDDSEQRAGTARILSVLHTHFDLVLQSCHMGTRLPDSTFFDHALQKLGVSPNQVIFVSAVEGNLATGRDMGMDVVLMDDTNEVMKQLQTLSGVELLSSEETFPVCCNPEDVPHCYVTIKPGVQTHYVDMGEGPAVLLCHGFPESWFSWRYQIPALAEAGFRALVPDMKGYGNSSAPPDIQDYSQEQICQDLVTFLDKLGVAQVTLVGHDWGGTLVWNMAQHHPERVRAVASLNTPLFPVDPKTNPMERIKAIPVFDYQIYFQDPGVAEAEMEKDLERTFKIMFTGSADSDKGLVINTENVCERGGLFVGLPDDVPRSSMLSESALQYYVQQYSKSGFRGPLNWYRNIERNWRWACARPRKKILMPALMVTAGKDPVLQPALTKGMENMVPNLTRGHIEQCGHWTQMERPAELNKILLSWLNEVHQKASIPVSPRL
ncbi:hypothetical protein AGOR_G00101090 [Albula goreensis]|uniref:AB hydrolase-1 domain-containing protein n=1 Tax=Albula goreensis TaxID=1534307 RepID=A0A8T3DHR8_9TELE|nr:hypothetical protein AGOR_G00101090 [Albula goreensis]